MANRKRTPFDPNGPFISRREGKLIGPIRLRLGAVYAASLLGQYLGVRKLESLFEAYWFDIAPADYDGIVIDEVGEPLDRDGDGKPGGDLTDAEIEALAAYGISHEDWCRLPEPDRSSTLQAAIFAMSNPPTEPEAPETPDNAQQAPEAPPVAEPAPETPQEASTAATEADNAPEEPGPVVAYKNFGFGNWYAVGAKGAKIGKAVKKGAAAGLAAQAGVPVLGQDDPLPQG